METIAPRLRQAVLVARDLEQTCAELRRHLRLGEPYRDPGVREFGLANAVFEVGDCFLEVVSPVTGQTSAGRHLDRSGGDCGYMVMFEVEDMVAARAAVDGLGFRVVWEIELADIAGMHLHPSDVGGVIVSLDHPRPVGSWRWGGPRWTAQRAPAGTGALVGVTIAVPEAERVAARWARMLGLARAPEAGRLQLPGGWVQMREPGDGRSGLTEVALAGMPGLGPGEEIEIAGVRFWASSAQESTAA